MNSENETQENQSSSEEKKIGYAERFQNERSEWTQKLGEISKSFKQIDLLVDVQVDLYSSRQQITEYVHELTVLFSKLKKKHLTDWKKAYDLTIMSEDYRYSEKERSRISDEKTSESKLKLEIVQTHIDFFRESVKTIDSMIFGVKHRLEIEDFKRGNK